MQQAKADKIEFGSPVVGRLYSPKELSEHFGWWTIVVNSLRPLQYPVPVEVVLHRPSEEILFPMARAYSTEFYGGRDVEGKGADLIHWMDFQVSKPPLELRPPGLLLAEVWGNQGDDGHPYYELEGYAFAPVTDMGAKTGGLPDRMEANFYWKRWDGDASSWPACYFTRP